MSVPRTPNASTMCALLIVFPIMLIGGAWVLAELLDIVGDLFGMLQGGCAWH